MKQGNLFGEEFAPKIETKYTQKELEKMSRSDMAHYIVEITQTTICKDKSYCDLIMKIWLKK